MHVIYMSVTTAAHRPTVTHPDTRRDEKETARRAAFPQPGSIRLTSGRDTRSARCGESRTPGAEGGLRETAGGNTSTAPAGLPYEDALCKLTSVVSRLAGHQTARAVIEAMIAGERDPRALAALGRGRMRNDRLPALAEALTGMRFGPQHAHAAASLLRAIDLLEAELRDLQERVTAHLAAIPASWGVDADGVTGPAAGRAGDAAVLPAADRLDEIPGLGREAAAALIAGSGSPGRFPGRGPLRTVRARHPGTRLKQAPGTLRARVLASCAGGPEARDRRRRVSSGFGSRPVCHARPGGRGDQRRSPCGPC